MIVTDSRTPESELQALKDLVACDGWDLLRAHLDTAWGPEACLERIDAAIKDLRPGDELAELAVTKRIRDTFKGVRAEARWVEHRILELEAIVKERQKPSLVDRFAGLRRVPR